MMKLLSRIFLLLLGFLTFNEALATHNRAGEITYEHISGFTYEITITTYTKTSVIADRPWLEINWGDIPEGGQLDSLPRQLPIQFLQNDVQINTYKGVHTYGGPGIYGISVLDPNRNENVLNIPGSVQVPFTIESTLIINPQTGHNSSVTLLNPAIERACLNKRWIHNPGAYDPDGDLLTYSLVPCLGQDYEPVFGYSYPDEVNPGNDSFTIDPNTGDVVWEFPLQIGEYNIGILIEEWRLVNGVLIKVGDVVRDMQITVELCDNNPPEIEALNDVCVEAGNVVSIDVNASDPDNDPVLLSAVGGPMTETVHVASFSFNGNNNGTFTWLPRCEEVRPGPYQVLFRAEDTGNQVPLTDLETWNITVVGPPVENPIATPSGNTFELSWNPTPCLDIFAEGEINQGSYKIYRRLGEYGFEPENCEIGVPEYTGYSLIGEVDGLNSTAFVDNEVFFGGQYCYMVVTCFPNGAVSLASEEFCGFLNKEAPVITNVSVEATDPTNGEVYLAWSPPGELDTEVFPGPYRYLLYHSEGFGNPQNLILETLPQLEVLNPDTIFTHLNINTASTAHAYRVELWSGEELVQSSSTASSMFLELIPDDNELTIAINLAVPWMNMQYDVFRFNNDLGDFELIGNSTEPFYTDTGLINNVVYCYYVQSTGTYGDPSIIDPLLNSSQEACGKPIDLTPPCAPVLQINADCSAETTELTWNNPNNTCADDVTGYNIYYAPTPESELELLASYFSPNDTSFTFNAEGLEGTIAGCFAITALDSLLPDIDGILNQNESEFSNVLCADNCPFYVLPNVFTPNNDGQNDLFQPFPFKFVESINLKIFNRWGGIVFETTDPEILWDGKDNESGEVVNDGVYYYTITINTIRLSGIEPEETSGHIQVLGGSNQSTN